MMASNKWHEVLGQLKEGQIKEILLNIRKNSDNQNIREVNLKKIEELISS